MSTPNGSSRADCPTCRRFLPDRYVKGLCPHCGAEARGDECDQGCGKHLEPGEITKPVCTVCDTPAELREQEHFFFRLSTFGPFLLEHLKHLRGTSNARNYALGWVRDGLRDWCITRTLEWGVRFPGRDDLVVYVWVDAPIGYIAFTEEWAATHGKDWRQVLVRRRGDHPLHRRRHHLPPLHLLAGPAEGSRVRPAERCRRIGHAEGRRSQILEVAGVHRLDERGLPRSGAPGRLPPLLSRCLHKSYTRAELLLAGFRR